VIKPQPARRSVATAHRLIRIVRFAGRLIIGTWIVLMLLAAGIAAPQDYQFKDTFHSLELAGLGVGLWVAWTWIFKFARRRAEKNH